MTNKNKTTLYVGVTSELINRVQQHKQHIYRGGFSARYNLEILVYYQWFEFISSAIIEEKRLKAGSRKQKIKLINSMNPDWKDLFDELVQE